VLDRIEMNVVNVAHQVRIIADRVFPIAVLPQAFSRFLILLPVREAS
jgi:hypothetical protein